MIKINENFLKLQAGYLFPEIGRRVAAHAAANPQAPIIKLGIGDVTEPLPPAIIEAMHAAVDEMARGDTFRGYGPEQGYEFLRKAVIENDFRPRGVDLEPDEVFISDGSKCDVGNFQEIFGLDNVVAVTDPVYPVYVDTNVMAGRTGDALQQGGYAGIVYMPCTAENSFVPKLPDEPVDLVYLCYPNNPTGAVATREQLGKWVDYASQNKAIILFDAAYEAFISDPAIPHSIYEIDGLRAYTAASAAVDVNPIWNRRHSTKFNGASYISQAGAAAIYTPKGKTQIRAIIDLYMSNAATIRRSLTKLGYEIYGGVNAPYVWLKTPAGVGSWEFFDILLSKANVVGTPGAGFGTSGEGYFRLSAFNKPENVKEAMDRFAKLVTL